MPRVSVLIPTYNRADYLPEAMASALAQTYADFEVVIVDDGSTDNTAEVVSAISDPRVRYIRQENRGVAAAFNTAWQAARGEYLAMLGSDDVWLPTLLAELVPALDADFELGLIYGRAQGMAAGGEPLPQVLGAPEKFPGEWLKSLLYGDCVCGIACVFRRACIECAGGFDESMIANEDWDLWIRMAGICRFAYLDRILARYRMHPQSLTGGRSRTYRRVIFGRVRLIETYYARPGVPPAAREVERLARRNVYMDCAIRLLSIGEVGEAAPYVWRAVRAAPNPITGALRVLGVATFDLYLSKTRWGVRLVETLVQRRRKAAQ